MPILNAATRCAYFADVLTKKARRLSDDGVRDVVEINDRIRPWFERRLVDLCERLEWPTAYSDPRNYEVRIVYEDGKPTVTVRYPDAVERLGRVVDEG